MACRLVKIASSLVASGWQSARTKVGPGHAVLAIMVLEVSAARLLLLKRCAPVWRRQDNEISALRILEREL